MRKVRLLVLVLALFLAILATTSYSARAATQSSGGSHFVSIPTTAQADFPGFNFPPPFLSIMVHSSGWN